MYKRVHKDEQEKLKQARRNKRMGCNLRRKKILDRQERQEIDKGTDNL